jgi:hypothetical protein
LDISGADAGQRLTGFSVRVPQDSTTGPGSLGTLTDYVSGPFDVDFWYGTSALDQHDSNKSYRRSGRIALSPTMEITFTANGYTSDSNDPRPTFRASPDSLVDVTVNITPLVYGNEPLQLPVVFPRPPQPKFPPIPGPGLLPGPVPRPTMSPIKLESIICWGECAPNEGVTGAAFGTDDRTFQLRSTFSFPTDHSWHYRMYDITYSITDMRGTRNTVRSTITIASRNQRNQ